MVAATKTQAEQCDPNALNALVTEWQTVRDTVQTGLDKAGDDYRQSVDFWTGKTGDRARDAAQQTVTAGGLFTGDLTTAIATLAGDRDAIWAAKNRAVQAITIAIQAKYDVAENGDVEPSEAAKAAADTSSEDPKDRNAALAALNKYGKDTLQPPIKSALADLGTAIETATTHIQNAFANSGGVTSIAVEAPGKLDPTRQLTAEQGRADGETIADGKLSDEEKQRILDHLQQTGLTPEQLTALQAGEAVTVPASTMDYLTNLYDKAGRDGLLTLSSSLKADGSPQSTDLRTALANGMLTLSNENVVSRDAQGKINNRGGFDKLDSEIREIVGTRPGIAGAPDANTRDLPDDYRSDLFGPKIDARSGIKDYTADMDRFADFLSGSDKQYQPGDRFGVELGRQAAHQAWILDHGGYGKYEGTKLPDTEALQHTENSAQSLLGVASRNHDANYALLTGQGSEELFGKGTPGQSWHPYDRDSAVGTLLTHEWKDDGAALGRMVEWTATDALSADQGRAEHAGQAANAIAELMSTTKAGNGVNMYESLLNMPGQSGHSFAEVNPRAAQSIATALSPYVGDMVGAPASITGTHGFRPDSTGPVEATRVFSILDGDPEASRRINISALAWADQMDRNFAANAALSGAEQVDMGHYSGRIRGLVDAGMNAHVADLNLNETDRAKALTDQRAAVYGVAQNLIGMSGVAGTPGGIGGPIAQAVSEYYKAPITSVDPSYGGHTPSTTLTDPATGKQYDILQSSTLGNRRYNMLAALIQTGQVDPGLLPNDIQNAMLTSTDEGYKIKPYALATNNTDAAGLLDRYVPNLLNSYGVSNEGQQNYLNNGDQAAKVYQRIISDGTMDGQQQIKRLTTDELERQGYNTWSTTR
ncbi:hypothetical protein NDR87_24695 [Nocardia sp. CDC159]|uniref:TPR repeat domain-containing protein n=1 Tax=Nocardia pulmonis TaxID=2951408 RepID=A0A9X2IWN0_9NOCA|nr:MULTISPECIES: hypothetical protein [Nocardia]MCM6775102.1 hypothetical protein [Nocardia pulmonis]MCM6789572.1 hypothetical protein [Nocardia sp. CDC159]